MAANFNVHPHVANFFYGYQPENLWYLLFDYNRRDLGPAGFDKSVREMDKVKGEREVGYMSGMFSGFDYVLATIDEPLSLNYLRNLHSRVVSWTIRRVHGEDYRDPFNCTTPAGVIRSGLTATGLRRNVTPAGLKELRNKIRNGDDYFRLVLEEDYDEHVECLRTDRLVQADGYLQDDQDKLYKHKEKLKNSMEAVKREDLSDEDFFNKVYVEDTAFIIRGACSQADIFKRLNNIIDLFHGEMATAQISEEGKIRAIAICLHEILLTHPFPDGNGRTTALLLNKLLLQYNLCPALLSNPTIIDAFSIKELCAAIKTGQGNFITCSIPYSGPGKFIFLKGNPNVTALFVYTSVASATKWDTINVGEQNDAMNLFLAELSTTISMTIDQIKTIKLELRKRVRAATYKRESFGFFSNAGNMLSEVARNAAYGEFKKALYRIFDSSKHGIDFRILAGNNRTGYQDNPLSSNHNHLPEQRMQR